MKISRDGAFQGEEIINITAQKVRAIGILEVQQGASMPEIK